MPFYEYRCETCGHEMEVMQKMSDPPVAECPACGEPNLRKLVSAAGFRLKGGGWYETDFKKGGKKNVHDAGGGKESSPAPACGAGACSACQS
jgi:putative FmdB family regulatory protein